MTKPSTPAAPAPDPADPLAFTPVPRKRMRRRGWSAARQREFIEHLAETGSVRAACRRMGVGEHQVYVLRNHPEGASFRKAWEAALDMGIQRIEDVAMDRALNGVDQPVFYHGEAVGERKVYNDRLLMFLLSNRAPERFAAGGGPRGLNAVGQMELERLRKQWRKEWEAEMGFVSAAEIKASIDRKIENIRRTMEPRRIARWAAMSEETREAFARFIALRDRDLAAMKADEATRALMAVDYDTPATCFEATGPISETLLRAEMNRDEAPAGREIVVPCGRSRSRNRSGRRRRCGR
ncbi:hypothetical protein [Porphyrobacter sp. CACIAM 03H1]|uniref:hypothetical protein n=1 Tax=Porphyrobacter sp. CACIAM 03H1 TaxID=2003315 RepID=UPI000B5A3AFA|nr:hypothetical protein [Porphyrobacter sp. CACIAM 03H1]ASJ91496.1 hypothetical protein CBR61_11590 [Porphyrobacter sp. CACIAM 03H1]